MTPDQNKIDRMIMIENDENDEMVKMIEWWKWWKWWNDENDRMIESKNPSKWRS